MARAYRRRTEVTAPVEALRAVVDEHLRDDPSRPSLRPSWDALDVEGQREVVEAALQAGAIADERTWLAGLPCARPLVGAVAGTVGVHVAEALS